MIFSLIVSRHLADFFRQSSLVVLLWFLTSGSTPFGSSVLVIKMPQPIGKFFLDEMKSVYRRNLKFWDLKLEMELEPKIRVEGEEAG